MTKMLDKVARTWHHYIGSKLLDWSTYKERFLARFTVKSNDDYIITKEINTLKQIGPVAKYNQLFLKKTEKLDNPIPQSMQIAF